MQHPSRQTSPGGGHGQFVAPIPFPIAAIADHQVLGDRLVPLALRAWGSGLPWICLRARGAATPVMVDLGRRLEQACPGVFLSSHGDPEACHRLGSPGLHLPSAGHDVATLRREFPRVVLGVSCHSRPELEAAEAAGADYAFLSPLYRPISKPARSGELGLRAFRATLAGLTIPVLALGGVTPGRVRDAAAAGASGAAVLGSLFLADDVAAAAAAYVREAATFPTQLPEE